MVGNYGRGKDLFVVYCLDIVLYLRFLEATRVRGIILGLLIVLGRIKW